MNDNIIQNTKIKMTLSVENLEKRFSTVRAGRANPSSLDGVLVPYYGVDTPLKQLAIVSVPEATQLLIKPFDRSCLGAIEKAILGANLGFTPGNDGEAIRIVIPSLTEDRRRELTKQVKSLAEEAKVAIRNIRRDAITSIEREEISLDDQKGKEKEIQVLVDQYNKLIDDKLKVKVEELLTV